jgi:hypothetical protein
MIYLAQVTQLRNGDWLNLTLCAYVTKYNKAKSGIFPGLTFGFEMYGFYVSLNPFSQPSRCPSARLCSTKGSFPRQISRKSSIFLSPSYGEGYCTKNRMLSSMRRVQKVDYVTVVLLQWGYKSIRATRPYHREGVAIGIIGSRALQRVNCRQDRKSITWQNEEELRGRISR